MTKKFAKITEFFEGSLVLFFTSTFAAIILVAWFFIHLISIEKHKIQTALEMESTRLEVAFLDRIEHTFALIKNINSQVILNPQSKQHIYAVLEKFRTTPELSDTFSWTIFSWSNLQRLLIVDAHYGIMKEPYDLSKRDYMPLTQSQPKKFHLGEPIFGSTSKTWMIPGGVGAVDKNGKYVGTTSIGFGIESLARSLHKSLQNPNISFELFDAKDVAILHANHCSFGASSMKKNNDALFAKLKNQAQLNEFGIASEVKIFGKSNAMIVKKFHDFPYYAVLTYNKNELRNQIWKGIISRSIEIFSLFFIAAILLTFIYKKERAQKQRILRLKSLIEKTHDTKNEFIFESAQKFKSFVTKIRSQAQTICHDLNGDAKYASDIKLSSDIIQSSQELAEFIDNMIELSKNEEVELKIGATDDHEDILRIVKRSVKLLETIADSSNIALIKKVKDTLAQLSEIEPNKVKQIIINLMPQDSSKEPSIKVEINNDNDEEK